MHATCRTYIIIIDLIAISMFAEGYKYWIIKRSSRNKMR
jgi:hypothetical protein